MGRLMRTSLLVAGAAGTAAAVRLSRQVPTAGLTSAARPAETYESARELLRVLQALDGPEVGPASRSKALLHGIRTKRVVVLVHGLSSSPAMWRDLGQRFFDLGYNVVAGRLPYHGLEDRMTTALANLTAEDLVAHGDAVVDIATGLGEEVVVVGISLGGVLAAWLAENRADVHTAAIVNPNFSAPRLRGWSARLLTNALLSIPNQFLWWDMKSRDRITGPSYAYPRFSTKAVGEAFRLGQAVLSLSDGRPLAKRIVVMTTEADPAVSNAFTDNLVSRWQGSGMDRLTTYRWRRDQIAAHDILSPDQPYQQVDLVYPTLIQLVEET